MTESLRRVWTEILTAEDYDQHIAAIGQAQAGAELTRHSCRRPVCRRVRAW